MIVANFRKSFLCFLLSLFYGGNVLFQAIPLWQDADIRSFERILSMKSDQKKVENLLLRISAMPYILFELALWNNIHRLLWRICFVWYLPKVSRRKCKNLSIIFFQSTNSNHYIIFG